jgi:hypothetical protein
MGSGAAGSVRNPSLKVITPLFAGGWLRLSDMLTGKRTHFYTPRAQHGERKKYHITIMMLLYMLVKTATAYSVIRSLSVSLLYCV